MIRAIHDIARELRDPFWAAARVCLPPSPLGVVVLAHNDDPAEGNQVRSQIARHLAGHQLATCMVGLTEDHEHVTGRMIVDIETIADRLRGVIQFMSDWPHTRSLSMAVFGEDLSGAAVMMVAAEGPTGISAAGTYCGRPDIARIYLSQVHVPTLLVVPGRDHDLRARNEQAFAELTCACQIAVIGNATRKLTEIGAVTACQYLIRRWCEQHLALAEGGARKLRRRR